MTDFEKGFAAGIEAAANAIDPAKWFIYTGPGGHDPEPFLLKACERIRALAPVVQPAPRCERCQRGDHSAHGDPTRPPPNGCLWCKCGHEAGCPCAGCSQPAPREWTDARRPTEMFREAQPAPRCDDDRCGCPVHDPNGLLMGRCIRPATPHETHVWKHGEGWPAPDDGKETP